MPRRSRATLGACAVTALALLAGGCGDDSGDRAAGTPASSTAKAPLSAIPSDWVATTPPANGDIDEFSWAVFYEPDTIDWTRASGAVTNAVVANMCESLVLLQPDMSFKPGLAESSTNPDPKTWVYKIRAGVKFWDGKEMTVDDVIFSLKRNLEPTSLWGAAWEHVDTIEQTGPWEVTVKLKQPDALFNSLMATPAGVVGEAAYIKEKGDAYGTPSGGAMCTGPLAFSKWDKGQSITLTRHEDYWDPERRAHAGTVKFQIINDDATRTSALLSGEVDGTYWVSAEAVDQLKQGPGAVTLGRSTTLDQLPVTEKDGPLHDPRIREAFSLILDREAINDAILHGLGQIPKALTGPSAWGYAEETFRAGYDALPSTELDLERAKQLVQEAGSPQEPIVITLAANLQAGVRMGTIIQDAAGKVGLNVKLNTIPSTEFGDLFYDPAARKDTDTFLYFNYADVADPLQVYVTATLPGGIYNYMQYDNPIVNEALGKARKTYDEEKRADLIVKAQAQVMKDLPSIPVLTLPVIMFQNKRITGAPASQAFYYAPWANLVGAP